MNKRMIRIIQITLLLLCLIFVFLFEPWQTKEWIHTAQIFSVIGIFYFAAYYLFIVRNKHS